MKYIPLVNRIACLPGMQLVETGAAVVLGSISLCNVFEFLNHMTNKNFIYKSKALFHHYYHLPAHGDSLHRRESISVEPLTVHSTPPLLGSGLLQSLVLF